MSVRGLKNKIVFPLFLILIVIVIILNINMSMRFMSFSSLLVNERLNANINLLNFHLENSMSNSRTAAVMMAMDPDFIKAVKERDMAGIIQLLEPTHELFGVNFYTVTDHEGVVLGRSRDQESYGDSMLYQQHIQDAMEGNVSSYYEEGTTVKVSIRTGAPVYDADGTLIGIISAGVRFDTNEAVDELKNLFNSEITVFFGDTRIATTLITDGQRATGTKLDPEVAKILIDERREYIGEVFLFGMRYETYYKPLLNAANETFAIIFLGIPIDDLRNETNLMLFEVTLIGVIGIAVSLILLNALRSAMAANRAKSDFLANVSHEIRTPLNAIIGMTSIAGLTDDSKKKDYAIGKIKDASDLLLDLINDILDMAKIEANKLELMPESFVFGAMLRRVSDIVNVRIAEKNQTFSVRYDEAIPSILICDEKRLMQVITNLLANAVKFTPEDGVVGLDVRLLSEENGVYTIQFDVSDTGIGISKEQQARLFRPFEQAESSTTRNFGGTGLGLTISKRIVEMLGGEIWITSEIGAGSVFSFTIQAIACGKDVGYVPPDEASDPEIIEAGCFAGYRVLIAEDVEINREIMSALLEPTLIEIEFAVNGLEAVNMFSKKPGRYDLIFMDIQMPEMDGYEAARRIRAASADVPIIALSANVFKEDVEKSIQSGMNGHIGKPMDFSEVLGVLRKYLFSKK